MVVDSHVHTRDFLETHKETVAHALYVAKKAGVSGIFAMPNPTPPLTTRVPVEDYLRLADESETKGVFFGVYMALTKDKEQVRQAVATYRALFPRVLGFKIFLGHSTNNLGVTEEDDQRGVFRTLAQEGYLGVTFAHAEKQSLVRDDLFVKASPITHATRSRPPKAEVASIRDALRFSREEGFRGKLHIAHISTPQGVDLVTAARKAGQDVSCGVTPHHLILNYSLMTQEDGIQYKVNPPLRQPEMPPLLLQKLEKGEIDWIETDHAPHALGEKIDCTGPCLSGLTSLHAWPLFLDWLRIRNWSEKDIQLRTHTAIVDRFGIDIPHSGSNGVYDPTAYPVNSWAGLEHLLMKK